MVLAWYIDSSDSDCRNEHITDPPKYVEVDSLRKLSGVLYWKLEGEDPSSDNLLQCIQTDRGYNYTDVIDIEKDRLPNYEDKLKIFFTEHLHSDEEIRLILDGSCYFDVRDSNNDWIRIRCEKGDLIVLPAGIYHRFTLDTKNYVKAMRLFCGEPVWKAINRPADYHPARLAYLEREK